MNGNLLTLRKKALSARIRRQRLDLSMEKRALEPSIAAVDRGISYVRYLKAHPLIPAIAAIAFFALRPARAFKWIKRGWFFWGLYSNVRRKLAENA